MKVDLHWKFWPEPLKLALFSMHRRFSVAAVLLAVSTAIEVAIPLLQGKVVDLLIKDLGKRALTEVSLWFLAAIALKGVADALQAYVVQGIGQDLTHRLRMDLFRRMLNFPVRYFDKFSSGRLVTRVIHDLKSIGELFSASICVAGLDAIIIVASLVTMFWLQAKLALLVLIPMPFAFYLIHRYGEKVAAAYRIVRAKLGAINGFLGENFSALASLQRLSGEENQNRKFTALVEDHQNAQLEGLKVFAMAQPIINGANGLTFALLIFFGGMGVIEGQWSLGVLVAFLGYIKNLFQPLRDLIEKYNTFVSARVALERVFEIFGQSLEHTGTVEFPQGAPAIELEDVTFQYPEGKAPVLTNASLSINSGETVAFIGATGGGKSTLFRLLLGFYSPVSGTVKVAGRPLYEWDAHSLRGQIGLVAQELFLFRGTVRENMCLGSKAWDDHLLIESLKDVGLWPALLERGGLDLLLEESGGNLSLGERQLLAMARVFLRNPSILLFDEVTSQIDAQTEERILVALDRLRRGRTCLLIAHRPKAAALAQRIFEVKNGKVFSSSVRAFVATGENVARSPDFPTP